MKIIKSDLLNLQDLKIRIKSLVYIKDLEYENNHWYATIKSYDSRLNDEMNDYSEYFQRFISLGKEIYDNNKCIKKMTYKDTHMQVTNKKELTAITKASMQIETLNCDYLILDKNYYNESIFNSVKKWCEKYPISLKEGNISYRQDSPNHKNQEELDVFVFIDLAIFSYLVYSSFNNYLLEKSKNKKDQEDYECGSKIRFNDFIDGLSKDDRDKFLQYVVDVITQYERKIYNKDNRPLLQETTTLKFNDINKKCEFSRTYENIYSVFWLMLKGQIYAMSNGNEIFHICRCGNVIMNAAEHCDSCKKIMEKERKRKDYAKNKNNKGDNS